MDSRTADRSRDRCGPTRRRLLTSVGCLGTIGLTGCLGSPITETATSRHRDVEDVTGRTVTVPESVDRLVAVGPGALNLVCYLEATDAVVGVEENEHTWSRTAPYNIANPSLRDRPIVGPHRGGDPELILETDPDVVVATYFSHEQAVTLQQKLDRPVVVLTTDSRQGARFEQFYDDLEFLGTLLGREKRAASVIEFFRSERRTLEERTSEIAADRRAEAYVAGRSAGGEAGATSTQHPFAPFSFVNVENVADSVTGHARISEEHLATWDPAVVFVAGANADQVSRELTTTYRDLTAVSEGNLHALLPSRFYGDLFGSKVANAYYVGSVMYPDVFSDVDPIEQAARIYRTILGADVYEELTANLTELGPISVA